jgi:hypothetical protein
VEYSEPSGVFAAPNECKVRGKVVSVEPGPEGVGSAWQVELHEADDVGDMPNMARARVGDTITVFVHPKVKESPAEGEAIQAQITYQGDEQGGAFFLSPGDVRIAQADRDQSQKPRTRSPATRKGKGKKSSRS